MVIPRAACGAASAFALQITVASAQAVPSTGPARIIAADLAQASNPWPR
jgi:hypothetical protein